MRDEEFLHTLTPAESDALEDMGEPGTYPPGAVIFEQGGTADCVLLVRSGRVRVAARGASGEEVVVAERGPGASGVPCSASGRPAWTARVEGPMPQRASRASASRSRRESSSSSEIAARG